MTRSPDWLQAARDHWTWRGQERPPFAATPGPGQESVWDYPRPPVLAPDRREVTIAWRGIEIARTCRAVRVLETAHPPTFYLPRGDIAMQWLEAAGGGSFCEWKGPAEYWSLVDGEHRLPKVAWGYPRPLAGAEVLSDCIAFYAHELDCMVDGFTAFPQEGGFYGGWITPDLTGPFKGEPGSGGW